MEESQKNNWEEVLIIDDNFLEKSKREIKDLEEKMKFENTLVYKIKIDKDLENLEVKIESYQNHKEWLGAES